MASARTIATRALMRSSSSKAFFSRKWEITASFGHAPSHNLMVGVTLLGWVSVCSWSRAVSAYVLLSLSLRPWLGRSSLILVSCLSRSAAAGLPICPRFAASRNPSRRCGTPFGSFFALVTSSAIPFLDVFPVFVVSFFPSWCSAGPGYPRQAAPC